MKRGREGMYEEKGGRNERSEGGKGCMKRREKRMNEAREGKDVLREGRKV
jgi:hypothetical protein